MKIWSSTKKNIQEKFARKHPLSYATWSIIVETVLKRCKDIPVYVNKTTYTMNYNQEDDTYTYVGAETEKIRIR